MAKRGRPRKNPQDPKWQTPLPDIQPVSGTEQVLTELVANLPSSPRAEDVLPAVPVDLDATWGIPDPPKPTPPPKAIPLPLSVAALLKLKPVVVIPPDPAVTLPPKALTAGAFFEQLKKFKPAEQVAWLRYNDKVVHRYLLRLGFESVKWALPKGLPPYTPFVMRRRGRIIALRPGHAPTELLLEARRLYLYIDGSGPDMFREKREKMFQAMIEGMAPEEVQVLMAIKDKRLDQYVSKDTLTTAFPGFFDQPFRIKFLR